MSSPGGIRNMPILTQNTVKKITGGINGKTYHISIHQVEIDAHDEDRQQPDDCLQNTANKSIQNYVCVRDGKISMYGKYTGMVSKHLCTANT